MVPSKFFAAETLWKICLNLLLVDKYYSSKFCYHRRLFLKSAQSLSHQWTFPQRSIWILSSHSWPGFASDRNLRSFFSLLLPSSPIITPKLIPVSVFDFWNRIALRYSSHKQVPSIAAIAHQLIPWTATDWLLHHLLRVSATTSTASYQTIKCSIYTVVTGYGPLITDCRSYLLLHVMQFL